MSALLRASLQSGPARLPVGLNEVEVQLRIEDDHPGGAIGLRG